MLAIPGRPSISQVGASRRNFLRVGSLSALGLGLPGLLRAGPIAPSPRSDVSCILVWLQGGMSPLDSFDPKPDSPSEVRGEFSTIRTRVPGISLCEHLPKLAGCMGKFAIVRALDPRNGTHGLSDALMMSGQPFDPHVAHPTFGSVVARLRGGRGGMPPFVQVGRGIEDRFGGGKAGFLGEAFDPLPLSVRHDSADTRYGLGSLGRKLHVARRLVDSGVQFVTVADRGWDTHRNGFRTLGQHLLPRLDLALSALLNDLDERGRLDSTLVVVLTDFGRTATINAEGGRDHCATASVALMAGAGIRGGAAVGATCARGETVIGAPFTSEDIAATVFDRLGIARDTTISCSDGRQLAVNTSGRPIRELL